MIDRRQANEPIYYGADQLQKTDESQLRSLDERHDDLRQLEDNIVQLHEIHRDFSELVSGQNQLIDNIEADVVKTETHVMVGASNIAKTVQLQSAIRRKKILCCSIVLIIVAIGITIGLIIYFVKKPK
ncbi:unnamed protein product [Adineta steineri]|uniref:t-SNARE coiled-coil homology domain-containing protein n=1 Tax=Adineta steineri TaxID=433720 RepID=A0A814V7Z6_9BILA|nr:unnamed protein product [Adineta steineri]CAF1068497.1 unnamed protein product [Adineta steineri]CAF1181846.1 unnamed protein product [Adineta steineri]CAF1292743.1 unnamed protein product [Adineta steineri]CAF3677392.1 unnamed protein product [Adineta steineri]